MTRGPKSSVTVARYPGRDCRIPSAPNKWRVWNRPGSTNLECQFSGFKIQGLIYLSAINSRFILDFFRACLKGGPLTYVRVRGLHAHGISRGRCTTRNAATYICHLVDGEYLCCAVRTTQELTWLCLGTSVRVDAVGKFDKSDLRDKSISEINYSVSNFFQLIFLCSARHPGATLYYAAPDSQALHIWPA